MSEQDNIAIVQQAYTNFKTGNISGLLDLIADDVTWELPEMEGVPFAGKRSGRDSVAQFFALVGESQDPLSFEPKDYVAQGAKVVSLGSYHWRVKSTNREFGGDFAHVFTIRNGKVAGFHEYTDTAAAINAYRRAMSA